MPIILEFVPKLEDIKTTSKDIAPLAKLLLDLIDRQLPFGIEHQNVQYTFTGNGFKIAFINICTVQKDAGNIADRRIQSLLHENGLDNLINLARSLNIVEEGNICLDDILLTKTTTNFSKLLDEYKIDEIPEEYQCALSTQIMDNPVYIESQPDIFYEKEVLRRWLFTSPQLLNPFTKTAINLYDIRENVELRLKIQNFVTDKIKKTLHAKYQPKVIVENAGTLFKPTQPTKLKPLSDEQKNIFREKYGLTDIEKSSLCEAMRKAAKENNAKDVRVLIDAGYDINAQDPITKMTALHYAVINESVLTVRLLKKFKADESIIDSNYLTSADYASTSNDAQIVELFIPENPIAQLNFM